MSPRFYSYVWLLFAVSAGLVWVSGAMSMVVVVAYGFVAFGLIFAGMMCVLPGVVAHPPEAADQYAKVATRSHGREAQTADSSMASAHFPLNPKFH